MIGFAMTVLILMALILVASRAIRIAMFCCVVAAVMVALDDGTPSDFKGPQTIKPSVVRHGAVATRVDPATGITATVFGNNVVWLGGE